jgi:mRNA-degrading endonuclease RelE of RelBE toxin-antitoxin system
MPCLIELTKRATKEPRDLPKQIQKRVARWLDLLVADRRCEGSKQLSAKKELGRVHAGKDYVIIYTLMEKVVLVVRIASRSEAYRHL